jgi:hypothetical protein
MTYGLYPFLLLGIAGIFARPARAAPLWLWAIPVLMLSTVMVLATNRFRAPIDPFILLLAAVAVTGVWQRGSARRQNRSVAAASG